MNVIFVDLVRITLAIFYVFCFDYSKFEQSRNEAKKYFFFLLSEMSHMSIFS